METNLEDASPEDLMAQLAAQFGGITATLEASQKAFEKARSKHFHAADYIFTSSGSKVNRKNKIRNIFIICIYCEFSNEYGTSSGILLKFKVNIYDKYK